jgi:hypothetical protein
MESQRFGKPVSDPCQGEKQDPDLHHSQKLDPDPHYKKPEALDVLIGSMETHPVPGVLNKFGR